MLYLWFILIFFIFTFATDAIDSAMDAVEEVCFVDAINPAALLIGVVLPLPMLELLVFDELALLPLVFDWDDDWLCEWFSEVLLLVLVLLLESDSLCLRFSLRWTFSTWRLTLYLLAKSLVQSGKLHLKFKGELSYYINIKHE